MDATIMRSTSSLIDRLRLDYPQYTLEAADEFRWSAARQTLYLNPSVPFNEAYSLHELSHALLDHKSYIFDVDLIKLERDAWEYARTELAPRYAIAIDDDLIQNNLETYREWLHARSECPDCKTTGLQSRTREYRCLACGHVWRVNEARICALRRYSITK